MLFDRLFLTWSISLIKTQHSFSTAQVLTQLVARRSSVSRVWRTVPARESASLGSDIVSSTRSIIC